MYMSNEKVNCCVFAVLKGSGYVLIFILMSNSLLKQNMGRTIPFKMYI